MKKTEIIESPKTHRAAPPKREEPLRILEHAGMLLVKGWIPYETEEED